MTVGELFDLLLDIPLDDFENEVMFKHDEYIYPVSKIEETRVSPMKGCENTVFEEKSGGELTLVVE